jgi:hypothetical protein
VCVCVCMCVCVNCVSKESYRAGCFHHFQILVLNRATDKRVCVLRKAVQEVSAMGQAVLSIKHPNPQNTDIRLLLHTLQVTCARGGKAGTHRVRGTVNGPIPGSPAKRGVLDA